MRTAGVMVAALVFLASAELASARQLVVVDSTVSELPPGKVIESSQPLSLPAGAKLTVMGDDGRMQKFSGPFSGALGGGAGKSSDPAVVSTLSRLFTSPTETVALGTFRGAEPQVGGFRGGSTGGGKVSGAAAAPDLWVINVQETGDQCLLANSRPPLWRPDAAREATVSVQRLPDGPGGLVRFDAGSPSAAWPGAVPLEDGDYMARDSADAWSSKLSLRVIPHGLGSEVNWAVWMADHGCSRQAKALLASIN